MLARYALALMALGCCHAQSLIGYSDRAQFDSAFDGAKGDRLQCQIHNMEPWIDFSFRFVLRYSVDCEVNQFAGAAAEVRALLRVKADNGAEAVFGDKFFIPQSPKDLPSNRLRKIHSLLGFSGAVAAGSGVYDLDLLVVDNRNRICRKHWKAKAFPHGRENELHFSLSPDTLAAMTTLTIPPQAKAGKGTALTVLLNAAPLYPWARKLRAWDRAFLLDSLSSLLRQIPCSSVRVVAFNLDQQREIYRKEDFTQSDLLPLNDALRQLELGKVAYSTLQNQQGWAQLLLSLLKGEAQSSQPSHALVFLGPTLRLTEKIPLAMLSDYQASVPPLFCVTYYPRLGADFPDSVQYLTTALKGKVFRIHSPTELAQNLQKLQHEVDGEPAAKTMRVVK